MTRHNRPARPECRLEADTQLASRWLAGCGCAPITRFHRRCTSDKSLSCGSRAWFRCAGSIVGGDLPSSRRESASSILRCRPAQRTVFTQPRMLVGHDRGKRDRQSRIDTGRRLRAAAATPVTPNCSDRLRQPAHGIEVHECCSKFVSMKLWRQQSSSIRRCTRRADCLDGNHYRRNRSV